MKMQTFKLSGLIFGLLLGANASADSTNPMYIVPAPRAGDQAATYPLKDLSFGRDAAGVRTLTFVLPEDLVGPQSTPITLHESSTTPASGELSFSGDGISALCVSGPTRGQLECKLDYGSHYANWDSKAVAQFLSRKYADNLALLAEKVQTSARFASDPEGVVIFTDPAATAAPSMASIATTYFQ